jgi:hypothetical protein
MKVSSWTVSAEVPFVSVTPYLVPMIPIEVDYADCDLGFLDLWVGHDPCTHIEFKA